MFGIQRKSGYEPIDGESTQPFESFIDNNDRSALLDDAAGDQGAIETGPPLEHDVASHERAHAIESYTVATDSLRWDRVENLDQFFTRVYEYHQNGGFLCICLKNVFILLQFIFVVFFATFLVEAIDYKVLFNSKNVTADGAQFTGKRQFNDAVITGWVSQISSSVVLLLIIAFFFWLFRVMRFAYQVVEFYEIYNFYRTALGIEDKMLTNLTWPDVVQRICEKQPSIHLIINKDGITPLDIYQRILRYKNYFVALVNQGVLPPIINVPLLGPYRYLSNGLKTNIEWLLFYGSYSPWKGPYELREEYKHRQNVYTLSEKLGNTIMWMGLFNFILSPFVFIYQILYSFFSYGELMKREPGAFGIRRYSNYGRNKLRHFNELDHELRLRLSRSHRAATQYMEQFVSPLSEIIAKNVQFVAGAILGVLLVLSAWDEDVLALEHILTAITVCGVIVVVCRSFIPDENMVYWPESLLNIVISNIHYTPDSWNGKAHADFVRREFGELFQLKAQFLIEEIISPFITPFILLFHIYPRAMELVDFFHNFTVNVEGLGDVCSFSLMDVEKHGDPMWGFSTHIPEDEEYVAPITHSKVCAKDGKTELSLLHFANNHPHWKPPLQSAQFLAKFRSRMENDLAAMKHGETDDNILFNSLHPFQSIAQQPRLVTRETRSHQTLVSTIHGASDLLTPPPIGATTDEIRESIDTRARSIAISVAFMRAIHTQNSIQRQPSNYGSLNAVRQAQRPTHNVWDVPAQSAFADSHAQHNDNDDDPPDISNTASLSNRILDI